MRTDRYPIEMKRQDAADAFSTASRYHAELKELYRHFAPWRLPTTERAGAGGGRSEGASMGMEHLFDGTGLSAHASFVAHMQADWMPHFEPIFKVEAGPLFAEGDEKVSFNRAAEKASEVVHGLLPPVRLSSVDMFADLFFGQGHLLLEAGPKRQPLRSVAVPPLEMATVLGPWGSTERWFWKRNYKIRHLPQLWPDAQFSDRINRAIKDNPNGDVEVVQYTYWDEPSERYQFCVWTSIDNTVLRGGDDVSSRTPRWVSPRLFAVPGESAGRGLAHLGLPSLKSLNKARELGLRAAAFALLGLWMRRHDGVFNPETAAMVPGAMWKVAHTSGPLKSIERLDVPVNFDLSHVIMKDEREQLRRVLLDDEMPELQDAVRSPTEIAARGRRYDRNRGGNTVRLAGELIVPLAQRSFEIAENARLLPTNMNIDQIVTQATVLAPAAVAARGAKVERLVSWLQIITGLFGPKATLLAAEVEQAIPDMARWLGVEEKHIRTAGGAEDLKAMIAQFAAQLVASEQAKSVQARAQTPPPEATEAMYLNGGGM